jgi:hypothetical protein
MTTGKLLRSLRSDIGNQQSISGTRDLEIFRNFLQLAVKADLKTGRYASCLTTVAGNYKLSRFFQGLQANLGSSSGADCAITRRLQKTDPKIGHYKCSFSLLMRSLQSGSTA